MVQRGHNRDAVFFEAQDYLAYLDWLRQAAVRYEVGIHAWCLMTNHIHLLVTPQEVAGVARMMQFVGRHYVPYVNHKYGRSGSIWEGRYKASLVDAENYLLACMRYIELNSVAAGIVDHAAKYRWSSFHSNALGQEDVLITPHSLYKALIGGGSGRANYLELFNVHQDSLDEQAQQISAANQTGTPLAGSRFLEQIEKALGRKTGQARRGRPKGYRVPNGEVDCLQEELKEL